MESNVESNVVPQDPESRKVLLAEGRTNLERFHTFAARYREDSDLRARIDSGDLSDAIAELDLPTPPENIQVRIVADTPEVVHVIMPPDPNADLTDESLSAVAGGKTAGSAGSASTLSTLACSCAPGSASTASTAGTTGSAS